MESQFSFKSIDKTSEYLHKDRGSKFYGYAYPVSSLTDVKDYLDALKELYPDASHICYAYILGIEGEEYRANDDGEPSNSAGQPILREIKSKEVTFTLVAVVRYFGGKKLGVAGLIDAYGTAAREALNLTNVKTTVLQKTLWIRHLGAKDFQVYEYANRLGYSIVETPNIPGGFFRIQIPFPEVDALMNALESLPNFDVTDNSSSV